MTFAKWLFRIAAVFGVLTVAPMLFLEQAVLGPAAAGEARGLWYGFVSVTLAWQAVYFLISFDPARYRPLMLLGAAGKTGFALAVCLLWSAGALDDAALAPALADLLLSVLFVTAFVLTAPRR